MYAHDVPWLKAVILMSSVLLLRTFNETLHCSRIIFNNCHLFCLLYRKQVFFRIHHKQTTIRDLQVYLRAYQYNNRKTYLCFILLT